PARARARPRLGTHARTPPRNPARPVRPSSGILDDVRDERRFVPRDESLALADADAGGLLIDHPAADDRATAIIHGQLEILLVDEALARVVAGLPLPASRRVHFYVLSLAAEARLGDPFAQRPALSERRKQVGVVGKQRPEDRQDGFVRQDHAPRRL